ncbi:hypothetical protein BDW02DRAFT_376644 [Decorospora gaudefroyi]|uniref:Uncharacterized protein n=1 Tax=Decorospora gaudefroyi TaxID=184978 RepID=A0A6A5K8E1_9PLEO|nr:hypothetical protein BDW02DRAFT_376644 [Decorospora gaudefroyi]
MSCGIAVLGCTFLAPDEERAGSISFHWRKTTRKTKNTLITRTTRSLMEIRHGTCGVCKWSLQLPLSHAVVHGRVSPRLASEFGALRLTRIQPDFRPIKESTSMALAPKCRSAIPPTLGDAPRNMTACRRAHAATLSSTQLHPISLPDELVQSRPALPYVLVAMAAG